MLLGGVVSDADGLGDRLCEALGDGDVGVGAGGLERGGLVRPGDGDSARDRSGVALADGPPAAGGATDVVVEPPAFPTPDNGGSFALSGASPPPTLYGVSVFLRGGGSAALRIAYTPPKPPAVTAVSRPAAITSRRVGLPRRDLIRPRS
ncbi:MAG: hypothetical protein GEU94_22020 [Micromonosporaceae bacterium]|nr:hypothetical protein [Micromonosporaceae bacterium]